MTPAEHAAEADRLLAIVLSMQAHDERTMPNIALAQVHATLTMAGMLEKMATPVRTVVGSDAWTQHWPGRDTPAATAPFAHDREFIDTLIQSLDKVQRVLSRYQATAGESPPLGILVSHMSMEIHRMINDSDIWVSR